MPIASIGSLRGAGNDRDSVEALSGFQRFPQWMWRNADVLDFVGWLREHNDEQAFEDRKCGFYGLDLYSLHASIEAVLAYLEQGRSGSGETGAASLQLLRTFRQGHHDLRLRRWLRHDADLRRCGRQKPGRAPAQSDGLSAARRPGRGRRLFLRGTKRARGPKRGGILPQHVSSRSFLLEPARHPHDGIARTPRRTTSANKTRRPRSSSGRTTHIWATRARRKWASAANSISVSSCANILEKKPSRLASPLTMERSRRRRIGTDRPNARMSVPAHAESYEALFHEVDVPNFFLNLRDDVDLAVASCARTARARHRRDLPAGHGIDQSLFSRALARSIRCCFAFRSHARRRTAGAHSRMGTGEVEETFPSGL